MRKKKVERWVYIFILLLSGLWGVIWLSLDNGLRGVTRAAVGDHGHKGICIIHSVFSLFFPYFYHLNLRALFHRTIQRFLTNFTTVPRAFKRWNRVYCMIHRSYMSLLCNCINHLLSKTLKRKIEAIILINEVNALGTTDGWNMVCYLSCLLWTLCFTVLIWIVHTNKHRGNLIL